MAGLRLTRRFLSTSSSSAARPILLGHFHNPTTISRAPQCFATHRRPSSSRSPPPRRASPSTSSPPRPPPGSPSSIPTAASCSSSGPRTPSTPNSSSATPCPAAFSGGEFAGAALFAPVSPQGGFEFRALCLTVHGDRPRLWLSAYRDSDGNGACWLGMPPSRSFRIKWPLDWMERHCVRSAGSLYWHVSNSDSALALDTATLQFSLLRAPAMIWDDLGFPDYRVGETPGDGRLCFAALDGHLLRLCARGTGSDDGWVLEREACLSEVPGSATDQLAFCVRLGDIDPGRTGKVFIRSFGYGHFSYLGDDEQQMRAVFFQVSLRPCILGHQFHAFSLCTRGKL